MTDTTKNRSIARQLRITMNTPDCWDDGSRRALQISLSDQGLLPNRYGWSAPSESLYQPTINRKTVFSIRIDDDTTVELPTSMLAGEREKVKDALSLLVPDRDYDSWFEEHEIEDEEPATIQDGSKVWVKLDLDSEDSEVMFYCGDASVTINALKTESPTIELSIIVSAQALDDCNTEEVQALIKKLKDRFVAAATKHGCDTMMIDCKVNSSFYRSETCDASFLMEETEEE